MRRALNASRRTILQSARMSGKVEPAYGALMQVELCCTICGAEVVGSKGTCVHLDPESGSGTQWKPPTVQESDRLPHLTRGWLATLHLDFSQPRKNQSQSGQPSFGELRETMRAPAMPESVRFAAWEQDKQARNRSRSLEVAETLAAAAQAVQDSKRFKSTGGAGLQEAIGSQQRDNTAAPPSFSFPALQKDVQRPAPTTAEHVTWSSASLAQRRDMMKAFHEDMPMQEPAGQWAEDVGMAEDVGELGSSSRARRPRREAATEKAEILHSLQGADLSRIRAGAASAIATSRKEGAPAAAPILNGVRYGPRNTCAVDTLLTVLAFTLSGDEIRMLRGQEEASEEGSLGVRVSLDVLERVLGMIRMGADAEGQRAKHVWYAHMCGGLPAEWEQAPDADLGRSLDQQSFACCCTCPCSHCRHGDCRRCEDKNRCVGCGSEADGDE